jgi:hypothetical protein
MTELLSAAEAARIVVDHDSQDQDDKPIEEGEQAPPADR